MIRRLTKMTENKAGRILYFVEQRRNIHCTLIFTMTDIVNPVLLQQALDDILTIFPLVNKNLLLKDDVVYFVDNNTKAKIIESDSGVAIGSERLNGHQFYVAYFNNQIRICVSHGITDGGGLFDFSKALILNYLEKLHKKHFNVDFIRRFEDGHYEDDQTDFYKLDYSNIEVKPAIGYENECFTLPETKAKGDFTVSYLSVNESQLLELAKKYDTSVATLTFYLFAKAVFKLNKDAKDNAVLARITADVRKQLGIPHSQLNCSLAAHLSLRESDLTNEKMGEILKNLKANMKEQLQPDVVRYEASVLAKTGMYKSNLHPTVSISYMGKLNFNEINPLISDFTIIEGEYHKINFFALNGRFKYAFHLGSGSEKYAQEISNILKQFGVESKASNLEVLEPEKE